MHPIIVEEKIDGANLGCRIVDGEITIQNRGHYIKGGEHTQFSTIPQWIQEQKEALTDLLGNENLILYGEWCAAKHSLPYDRLPGYFVAFDLFDIDENKFYSRSRFHTIMETTRIPVVPTIGVLPSIPCVKFAGAIKSIPKQHVAKEYKAKRQETIASVEFIQTLLNNQSAFRSDLGPVEGVVLRQDEAQWLKHRFKVVRSDFKAGIEERCHWSRRTIKKQRIDFVFQHFYIQQCYPFSDRIMSERTMPRHGTPRQHRQPPRCIMLAGLPGSGKSSFAMSLSESLNLNHLGRIKTLIANQDLLGRKQCQRVAGQASSKYRVIVDRCNLTTKERREWFQIMHSPSPDDISLVFFNVPADICARRVQLRLGHATMQQGKGSSTLLEQLSEQFEPPSEQEKCNMFGTIRIITSWDDACSLLEEWVPKT